MARWPEISSAALENIEGRLADIALLPNVLPEVVVLLSGNCDHSAWNHRLCHRAARASSRQRHLRCTHTAIRQPFDSDRLPVDAFCISDQTFRSWRGFASHRYSFDPTLEGDLS